MMERRRRQAEEKEKAAQASTNAGDGSSNGASKERTMKRKNVKGLALSAPAPKPAPSAQDSQIPGALGNANSDRGDTLEIGVEFRLDLKSEDLVLLKELGAGNGGTVSKVMHTAMKVHMARKIIHVEAKKEVRRRIVKELQIMHECNSPYIVSFYGAFMNDNGDVTMCMEYMDVGSLDSISKNFGPVRVDVLGKIAEAVLGGLTYLYRAHRIMHRDIKPSNILVNSDGQIKLCDFGVSSELENSVADTFVGTGTYMAPERIQGGAYTVKSDVWSVGLTLMELAVGKFPFQIDGDEGEEEASGPQGILDLLQQIVLEPAPKLPKSDAFPQILEDAMAKCLMKNPDDRPTPQELYENDPFLQAAKRTPVDLKHWAVSMMERHNRKSHLAPALSPRTKNMLRGEDTPSTLNSSVTPSTATPTTANTITPTSGDIPIFTPGTNGYPTPITATTGRPSFPMRTSSAQQVPSKEQKPAAYEVDTSRNTPGYLQKPMTLPIRQAPPPTPPAVDVRRYQAPDRQPERQPEQRPEKRERREKRENGTGSAASSPIERRDGYGRENRDNRKGSPDVPNGGRADGYGRPTPPPTNGDRNDGYSSRRQMPRPGSSRQYQHVAEGYQ